MSVAEKPGLSEEPTVHTMCSISSDSMSQLYFGRSSITDSWCSLYVLVFLLLKVFGGRLAGKSGG